MRTAPECALDSMSAAFQSLSALHGRQTEGSLIRCPGEIMTFCIPQMKKNFMITTFTSISALIQARQAQLNVLDADLSLALGYEDKRIVTLIRGGQMRLPLVRVPALADALSVEPRQVLQLAMDEITPGVFDVIEQVLNPSVAATHGGAVDRAPPC
jgi:hypothetical protein